MTLARVLLVEDQLETSRALWRSLRLAGYDVITARNGREALDHARAEPMPKVIVTDFMMPEMNGLELVRELKADEKTLAIPGIVLTAAGDPGTCSALLAAGAEHSLSKPVSLEDLFRSVERAVHGQPWDPIPASAVSSPKWFR